MACSGGFFHASSSLVFYRALRNRLLRIFSERSRVGVRLSSRFVAGMEIDDALRVAEAVNKQGMAVTLDSLGESVTTEAEAQAAAMVYHRCWMRSPSASSTPTSA